MSKAYILFQDGTIFDAEANLNNSTVVGELVFNTAMTGYQEILTDTSYFEQIVVMTYPLIGNYGIFENSPEDKTVYVKAFIIRENSEIDIDGVKCLSTYLAENGVLCLSNIDTRKLTKLIRTKGSVNCLITTDEISQQHKEMLNSYIFPSNIVSQVTDTKITKYEPLTNKIAKFAVINCGSKKRIVEKLQKIGVEVTVLPFNIDSKTILEGNFDAVIISDGPGNPKDVKETIKLAIELIGKIRLYGISLGHQIISLALGLNTYKLKFGHRGTNYPVINLETGKVFISTQNHGYTVDEKSITEDIIVTYKNINDDTIEGIKHKVLPIESVQFNPETSFDFIDAGSVLKNWVSIVREELCQKTN